MDTERTVWDEELGRRRCVADSKQQHRRCRNRPSPGATVCRFHGSRARQVAAAAARRLSEPFTRDEIPPDGKWRLYVIRGTDSGRLKIGAALDPDARRETLQVGSPELLEVVVDVAMPERRTEQMIHARFADERIHGEWFDPSERLLAWVDRLKEAPHLMEGSR